MGKGTTASGKPTGAPRATGPDEARRTNAGPRGTPERHAASHNQGTRTGANNKGHRLPQKPGSAHNRQRTTAREQVPGNTQLTHHKPEPGVLGYKQSAHTSRHTPQNPRQTWRRAAETRAKAQTPTPHSPARSGRVEEERARKHTHTPTLHPGVAEHSRNPSPGKHTRTVHPSQERRGSSGARTRTHTHPNTQARGGGAQLKPEPKHTHPHSMRKPGVAGYKGSAHTYTPTPQPGVAGRS